MGDNDSVARFRRLYWTIVHNVDALRLKVWEERGLTLPQLRLVFVIRNNPGCTTNFLAGSLGITMSTVSGQVDKLVRAGLVERRTHPTDRRVVPLFLTDEGEAIVSEIRKGNRAYITGLAEHLGDDIGPISDALERLAKAIEEYPAQQEPIVESVSDSH